MDTCPTRTRCSPPESDRGPRELLNPENRQILRSGKPDDGRGCRRAVTESDGDSGCGTGNNR